MDTFKDEYGKTLFNSFVLRRDEFAMERLLNAGADVNHVYRVSETIVLLHNAQDKNWPFEERLMVLVS